MKKIFSFLVLFLFTMSQSQELKDFIIPKGYEKILETKGDLDKDGKDETVMVFNTDKKNHKEFIHKLPKLIKMNEYKMGSNEIKVPNSTKYFNF
ncbi:MAG: hypothetical protein J6N74_09575 [Chryseobacterium sp.]|nr:hypothetical protein [Chryseobacterium sp.]